MTALNTLTEHVRATHDPAALHAYEAEKRKASNEKAQEAYLEVVAIPHESGCLSRITGTVEWCSCRKKRVLEAALSRYRAAWINP